MLYVTKTELMKRNEKTFYFDRCRERLQSHLNMN